MGSADDFMNDMGGSDKFKRFIDEQVKMFNAEREKYSGEAEKLYRDIVIRINEFGQDNDCPPPIKAFFCFEALSRTAAGIIMSNMQPTPSAVEKMSDMFRDMIRSAVASVYAGHATLETAGTSKESIDEFLAKLFRDNGKK